MADIRDAIIECLAAVPSSMTVRQLFYQLVGQGTIAKTEREYKGTVVRLAGEMRRAGIIPYGWISDNTRWMRKPRSHSSLDAALADAAQTHRHALWDNQDVYVEIWLEKDALAGVLYDLTAEWDVPLMVTRGYPSLSFLAEAADAIQAQGKDTHLYYFGDHDPSGKDIPRVVERDIREMAPDINIEFHQVAVTPDQIAELDLPTRPTKETDSRSKNFQGESVELDAIPPMILRSMVLPCIERHIDQSALQRTQRVEKAERETYAIIREILPDIKKWKRKPGG
jgi:hypothetical protein